MRLEELILETFIQMLVIREDAFGGTYFRDIYSNASKIWHKNSWKEFDQLKNIDAKFYAMIKI